MTNSGFPYRRIAVIGTTGSGKSTLAEELARRCGLRFVELDALRWEPHWTPVPAEIVRARVDEATRGPAWVVAGNYGRMRDLVWPRAEAIIWLDFPFPVVLWRLARRSFRRWRTRELLWGTNYESLSTQLKLWSERSLFHWAAKTHWRRRRECVRLFSEPAQAHLVVLRFRHPSEVERWLEGL